ncbi:unnamed protein product [Orchesella dallaii]|uniref:Sidoreflexin n=1 Tax=Orchesella dallaii TaxID=48710 RepID=A0ABP1R2U3_9HEXA
MSSNKSQRLNLEESRWDQNTYVGRATHFFVTTNPLNLFLSSEELEKARDIVTRYRKGEPLKNLSDEEIWRAKHIYDSAFHPDTGQMVPYVGRMCSQVPVNMVIVGGMLSFYKSKSAVMFWQWLNQTFNAIVNYSNRSGGTQVSTQQLGISYVCGTGGALAITTGLKQFISKSGKQLPLLSRLVPFVGVAAATCVNLPIMRSSELVHGIPVTDSKGKLIGISTIAAQYGIAQVVFSRIINAIPPMVVPPLVMNQLESRLKLPLLLRYPKLSIPIQIALVGILNAFAIPMCCAIFPQKSNIPVSKLESEIQTNAKKYGVTTVYYNKGL